MERKCTKNEVQINKISLRSKYWYESLHWWFLGVLLSSWHTVELDSKVSNQLNLNIYTGRALHRSSSCLLHRCICKVSFYCQHLLQRGSIPAMRVLYYNHVRPPSQNYGNILQTQQESRLCDLASPYFQTTISDVTGKGNIFLIKKFYNVSQVSLRHHGGLKKKISK